MQVKMAAEIGQDLNDKNEELTHELQEVRAASRRSVQACPYLHEKQCNCNRDATDANYVASLLQF
eukprot:SAG31_NODE_17768_length_658_cov_1.325581_2_plen_65_part_00